MGATLDDDMGGQKRFAIDSENDKKRGESEIEGKSGSDELMNISIALAWWQYSF